MEEILLSMENQREDFAMAKLSLTSLVIFKFFFHLINIYIILLHKTKIVATLTKHVKLKEIPSKKHVLLIN